jgi:hypothetical protein
MNDTVRVNFSGDILDIPVSVLNDPVKLNWWKAPRHSGNNDKLHACAKAGWKMYTAKTGQFTTKEYPTILKRNRLQFWLRCKLTRWGII